MGLGKTSRHTKLLTALGVPPVRHTINKMTLSLYYRILQTDTPVRDLCLALTAKHINFNYVCNQTLVGRLIQMGVSPVRAAMRCLKPVVPSTSIPEDGVVDSLRGLLYKQRLSSDEHNLVRLLCGADF